MDIVLHFAMKRTQIIIKLSSQSVLLTAHNYFVSVLARLKLS